MVILYTVLGWFFCGFVAYGLTLGDFTRRFPYFNNMGVALCCLMAGPFGLLASALAGWPWTWRLVPIPKEERWKIFDREYSTLGRDYFEKHHS